MMHKNLKLGIVSLIICMVGLIGCNREPKNKFISDYKHTGATSEVEYKLDDVKTSDGIDTYSEVKADNNLVEAHEEPLYINEESDTQAFKDAGFKLSAPSFYNMFNEIYMVEPNKMIVRHSFGKELNYGEIVLRKSVAGSYEYDTSSDPDKTVNSDSGAEIRCYGNVDGAYSEFRWTNDGFDYSIELSGAALSIEDALNYINEIH